MDILLLNAPRLFFTGMTYGFTTPPLGVAYLRGYLKSEGYSVQALDLNTKLMNNPDLFLQFKEIDGNLSLEEFLTKYPELVQKSVEFLFKGIIFPEIIGCSILESQSLKIMLPLLEKIKAKHPNTKIIVGGNSQSLIPDSYLKNGIIDYIVVCRGERILKKVIDSIKDQDTIDSISGIRYHDGENIVSNPGDDFDIEEQKLEFDQKNIDEYRYLSQLYDTYNDLFSTPVMPYSFSYGCTFNCTFCAGALEDRKHKHKTPKQILADVEDLIEKHGYRYFYFFNLHLNITPGFIDEFCDAIIDSGLKFYWSDSIKPLGNLTRETFVKLRKAGCIMLNMGVETGSESIIKKMRKGHTVVDNHNCLKWSHEAGIWNMVNFLVGFPGEGESEFKDTINFIKNNYEYIDSVFTNTFRLENNYIKLNPEEFGIKIQSSGELNNVSNVVLSEYTEGEKDYKTIKSEHHEKLNVLFELFNNTYKNDLLSHRMIFPLYDIIKDKKKIIDFYEKYYNKFIIRAYTESVFLGSNSNDRLPSGLSSNSIIPLGFVDKNIIKELLDTKIKSSDRILFMGNEPTIHPDFIELIAYAKEIGFDKIFLKTNARMFIYEDFASEVAKFIDEIIVIIDPNNKNRYQIFDGIKNWEALGKKANIVE